MTVAQILHKAFDLADQTTDLVIKQAVRLPAAEQEALLREIVTKSATSATTAIALLAAGDARQAAELADLITFRMVENATKYAPRLQAAMSGAKP